MLTSLKKNNLYLGLLLCWCALSVLTYLFSRDYFAYHCWFDDALTLSPGQRFFSPRGTLHDPAYFSLQAIGTFLAPFEVFFSILIFGALLIKLLALLRITREPSWLDVAPYLLVLSYLHDGTQIRVAI